MFPFSLSDDEMLGEADSFVGQSPPHGQQGMMDQPSSASLFQGSGAPDPFAQINQSPPVRPNVGLGSQIPSSSTPFKTGTAGLAPTTEIPASSTPMAAVPPMPNAGGKLQYSSLKGRVKGSCMAQW